MRVVESSPKSKSPASKPASRGRGFLSIALAVLASAFSFTPTAVHADTPVKGFFTDEEQAPAAKPKADAQPQATATATASAQAGADASVNVAVEGDEYELDTDPSALSDFREPLADYGTWTDDPTYGTVWYPDTTVVGADFAPYQTSGHWELDANDDWMWVSDYDWGYIPFHYGRWVWIGGRGWGWIPGRVYAPAWVTWRVTDYGYIGWAPMAPSWYWFGGSAVTVWSTPYSAYVFCPSTYVFHHHVHTYVVRDRDVIQRIGAHSRPYRAARPSAVGASPSAAAKGARAYRPASPSLRDAKIPDSAAPQKRAKPDARAAAFSRRSTTPQRPSTASRSLPGAQVGRDAPTGRTNPAARPTPRIDQGQTPRVNDTARPAVRPDSSPSIPSVSPSRPSTSPSRPAVSPSKPSTSPSRPSVSPSKPSTTPSRPSVSPSRPSVSPSRPSVSPSRPSVSPSRPSVSPSRPSFSPSRGGRR